MGFFSVPDRQAQVRLSSATRKGFNMSFYSSRNFADNLVINASASGFYRDHTKRALDFVLAFLLAPVAILLLLPLAVLVALDGTSPFYWQKRVGLRGREFYMLKLRSMVPNADALLAAYLAEDGDAAAEWDLHQKLKNDPRITRIGRFIRRTSLDELPQLWNVIAGEMSLVGPRPIMIDQRDIYPGSAYYLMRPGITGLWQISDRNECSFAERAIFDTRYHGQMSLVSDISVISRTVGVVFRATGH